MNIIVIEDDKEVSEYIEEIILNTEGLESAQVKRVFSGDEGHSLLQGRNWDLAIIDINLPVYDGVSILNALRQVNQTMPVIIVSGFIDSAKLSQLRSLNVYATMFKPITPEHIHKAITGALNISVN